MHDGVVLLAAHVAAEITLPLRRRVGGLPGSSLMAGQGSAVPSAVARPDCAELAPPESAYVSGCLFDQRRGDGASQAGQSFPRTPPCHVHDRGALPGGGTGGGTEYSKRKPRRTPQIPAAAVGKPGTQMPQEPGATVDANIV